MINEIRAQALAHAMELAKRSGEVEASCILKDASMFEAYLCGIVSGSSSIDDATRGVEPALDIGACDRPVFDRHGGNVFPVSVGQGAGHSVNQTFAGCDVSNCAHSNSSSVQDGESVRELPTPSRTETVTAPGDSEEAARTHGGAA